jgi:hypothetical protein
MKVKILVTIIYRIFVILVLTSVCMLLDTLAAIKEQVIPDTIEILALEVGNIKRLYRQLGK